MCMFMNSALKITPFCICLLIVHIEHNFYCIKKILSHLSNPYCSVQRNSQSKIENTTNNKIRLLIGSKAKTLGQATEITIYINQYGTNVLYHTGILQDHSLYYAITSTEPLLVHYK